VSCALRTYLSQDLIDAFEGGFAKQVSVHFDTDSGSRAFDPIAEWNQMRKTLIVETSDAQVRILPTTSSLTRDMMSFSKEIEKPFIMTIFCSVLPAVLGVISLI
jgi:hypothetical protein